MQDNLRSIPAPGGLEYQARLERDRMTHILKQKSEKQVDAGALPIEDSPLFGGPRQATLTPEDICFVKEDENG